MDEAGKELKAIQAVNRAMGSLSGPSIRRVMNFVNDVQGHRLAEYEKEQAKLNQPAAPEPAPEGQ